MNGGPPLALTMGDPAGIGGELTLKAWLARTDVSPRFLALDDPTRLAALARALDWPVPVVAVDGPEAASAAFADGLPVLPIQLTHPGTPGCPDRRNAASVLGSIEAAVRLAQSGRASGIVTNPINKAVLYAAGFPFPGHTEYLAELAGGTAVPVMMLAGPSLRVVPVTIHLALAEALRVLDGAAILAAARTTWVALRRDFQPDSVVARAVARCVPAIVEFGCAEFVDDVTVDLEAHRPEAVAPGGFGVHVDGCSDGSRRAWAERQILDRRGHAGNGIRCWP